MSGKKRNRFYYFVEEMVRDLKADGLNHVHWVMVNKAAGDQEWTRLSETQRSVYTEMANQKKFTYDPRMTPERRERVTRVRQLLQAENARLADAARIVDDRRRQLERRIRETLSSLPAVKDLTEKSFFVIDAEYFVADPFVPCEIAVVEISIRGGILDLFHFFVDPGEHFPINRGYDEKSRSDEVHGIPFLTRFEGPQFDFRPKKKNGDDDDEDGEDRDLYRNMFRDHGKLARQLRDFLMTRGSRESTSSLFTLNDRSRPGLEERITGVERVQRCCDWLLQRAVEAIGEEARGWAPFEILPLEQLVRAFHERAETGSALVAEAIIRDLVNHGKWDFLPKTTCAFHYQNEKGCVVGSVHRWCYALFDHLHKAEPKMVPVFDFEMTAKHVPNPQPTPFVVYTMQALEESLKAEEEEAFPGTGALSAITDAFAADLSARLTIEDTFRPSSGQRGVQDQRPLGMGRGTALKKTACQ